MKFDSNLAWQQASGAVSGNREMLFALAGVFFMLPSLAFMLMVPQPQPAVGMTGVQAAAAMEAFYMGALPWILIMAALQAAGSMALLTLMTDRARPTVGEAIKRGFIGLLPYLAAQLLLGMVIGGVGSLLLGAAIASGATAVAVLIGGAVIGAMLYAAVRTMMVAPVIMVEGVLNPVHALRRSWELTRGNALRIAAFFALIGLSFLIFTMIISAVIGLVAALIAGAMAASVINAVVSSAISAVMTLYLAAVIAAIHRQLGGSAPASLGATFD